jgi:hypothetical protein
MPPIAASKPLEKEPQGSAIELRLQVLDDKIERASRLTSDWDSYGSPAPSDLAVTNARVGLRVSRLVKNLPATIVPSAEGGIALCWDTAARHAYIEFSNEGTAIFVMYEGDREPSVAEIPSDLPSIAEATMTIQGFLSNNTR